MTSAGPIQQHAPELPTGTAASRHGTAPMPMKSTMDLLGGDRRMAGVRRAAGGLSTQAVIERRLAGHHDDAVLVIAVEGGGLRGVVSGAMLIALDELGITRVADAIVGTSAGAINVAYLAAGRSWDALPAYYDLLPTRLLRPPRQALRAPLLRMDYLDELFTEHLPLRAEQIRRHQIPVFATVTDVDQRRTVAVRLTADDVDVHAWLKASAWLPVLAGRPLLLDGRRWLDGGVLCPNLATVGDLFQATHILSVCSRAQAARGPSTSERLVAPVLNHWSAGLGDRFIELHQRWATDAAQLGIYTDAVYRGARVLRLAPHPHHVGRLTRDADLLRKGAQRGYTRVREFFDGAPRTRASAGHTGGRAPVGDA